VTPDPLFLSVQDVLDLHADTLRQEGGLGGLRDVGLLESAVMMPQQQFGGAYLHEDLAAMAAAYLYHLARNHPFADGNKRVAAMAAYVFLDVNGLELTAEPDDVEARVLDTAAGALSKSDLAAWIRAHVRAWDEG